MTFWDFILSLWKFLSEVKASQIAKFTGRTWGPPGSCRPKMGPMWAPWTLLSGMFVWVTFLYNKIYMDSKISRSLKTARLSGRFFFRDKLAYDKTALRAKFSDHLRTFVCGTIRVEILNYWGLATPCGVIELGQQRFRKCLVACSTSSRYPDQ